MGSPLTSRQHWTPVQLLTGPGAPQLSRCRAAGTSEQSRPQLLPKPRQVLEANVHSAVRVTLVLALKHRDREGGSVSHLCPRPTVPSHKERHDDGGHVPAHERDRAAVHFWMFSK